MKLNKLFLLMLALPMALVACKNSDAPKVESEYLFDVKMATAERISEIAEEGITFEDNQFFIAFADKNESCMLTLLLQGEEGETALSAGTFTSARGAVVVDDCMLVTEDETVYTFAGGEASVTVALSNAKVYTIEAIMTDANGNKYRFTYEGEISNMSDDAIALDNAERYSSEDFGVEDNYFVIMFTDRMFTTQLGLALIGAEGEDILSAGTYTTENGGIFAEGCELFINETDEYYFTNGNIEIVVGGDINGYTFDIKASDDKGNSFHYKYEGTVRNMNLAGEALPILEGFSHGVNEQGAHNYTIVLSDKGMTSDNYPQPNSQNYVIRLCCKEEGAVDAEGYITLPFGTYELDANSTHTAGTFCYDHSSYITVGSGQTGSKSYFQSGEITVTEDGIEIDAIIGDVRHHVVYNGYPKFLNRSAN